MIELILLNLAVQNTGNTVIDDELTYLIIDPVGERIYRKKVPLYLEPDESHFLRFSWDISNTASTGHYWFRAELDPDIDFLPTTKSFWVTGLSIVTPLRRKRKETIAVLFIGLLLSGCITPQQIPKEEKKSSWRKNNRSSRIL